MKITDAVVFITGANRGLGLALAQQAIQRGAKKVYAGMRNLQGFNQQGYYSDCCRCHRSRNLFKKL